MLLRRGGVTEGRRTSGAVEVKCVQLCCSAHTKWTVRSQRSPDRKRRWFGSVITQSEVLSRQWGHTEARGPGADRIIMWACVSDFSVLNRGLNPVLQKNKQENVKLWVSDLRSRNTEKSLKLKVCRFLVAWPQSCRNDVIHSKQQQFLRFVQN